MPISATPSPSSSVDGVENPPTLSKDEIDDLLYFARTGDLPEFQQTLSVLSSQTTASPSVSDPLLNLLLHAIDSSTGNGVLHMAAANGHVEIIDYVLSTPLPSSPLPSNKDIPSYWPLVTAKNHAGNTPLHYAALNGHLPIVKYLVERGGADPAMKNGSGHDAAFEARRAEKQEVVEFLLAHEIFKNDRKLEDEDESGAPVPRDSALQGQEEQSPTEASKQEEGATNGVSTEREMSELGEIVKGLSTDESGP